MDALTAVRSVVRSVVHLVALMDMMLVAWKDASMAARWAALSAVM